MTEQQFILELKKMNINCNQKIIEQLLVYYNYLIEQNKLYNLTNITEKETVFLKHFYDSLTITKVINLEEQETVCDIGSGAGFPGIVLKIFFPHLKITLLDSQLKRVKFLKQLLQKLELTDVEVINERAEIYSKNNREKFDVVCSRAVANLSILLEISVGLVKKNKYFVAMKGQAEEEIRNSFNCLKQLNCTIVKQSEFYLPIENSQRTIICIEKTATTNILYPRKYSEIKKKPL